MNILFWILVTLIFYTMVGYPITLEIFNKVLKKKKVEQNFNYKPLISFIIPAHNEEKSIVKKLKNIIELDYPKDKLEVIIASDNSTDQTNELVQGFIAKYQNYNLRLHIVKRRAGKTNAQNEAVRESHGEIIVFSDANSIWKEDSLKILVSNFYDSTIAYVCGKLAYINDLDNITAATESTYWNYDLRMREIESNLSSITAGNGAIYAIKRSDYIEIDLIRCHDGAYPPLAVINGKRAIYEKEAIAFEKAGENLGDEFSRKVRMNRSIITGVYSNLNKYNPFKVGIFAFFMIGHRYLRYNLWSKHSLLLILNLLLARHGVFYATILILHILFYILAFLGHYLNLNQKVFNYSKYYSTIILAQIIGVKKTLLGQNKPFWEKAESTR